MVISEEEGMLAWRLRQYREQAGLTQEKAAEVLGLDPTAISKIEHGERGVSAMELLALAKAYHTPTGMLLGEEIALPEYTKNVGTKRFYLERTLDPVGISGTGVIAEGVMFTSGKVVMQWLTEYSSIGIYDSVSDVLSIHGHNGTTSFVFTDVEEIV